MRKAALCLCYLNTILLKTACPSGEFVLSISFQEPLVTVITVVFNLIESGRANCILDCIKSVNNQTCKNVEHIIIDGASVDGTLDLLKEYEDKGYIKIYSEPDEGIYYAMNKGIDLAKGKYIAFLNSDDFWHNTMAIEESVKVLEKNNADFSYASCCYLDKNDNIIGFLRPSPETFFIRMPFCHQTMFTKAETIRKLGKFNTNYKSSADFDFVMRLFLNGAKGIQVNLNFTSYRWIGFSALQSSSIGDAECKNIIKDVYKKFNIENLYTDLHWNTFSAPLPFVKKVIKKVDPLLKSIMIKNVKNYKRRCKVHYEKIYARPEKIKICFDANILFSYYSKNSSRTGIFFVVYNVLKELAKREEFEIYLYCDYRYENSINKLLEEKCNDFPNVKIFNGDISSYDLYFTPYGVIPKKIRQSGILCYSIIYDLTPLNLPDFHTKQTPWHKIVMSLNKNDYLFSISEYTKQDFAKHLNHIDSNKITTTLLAANEMFKQKLNQDENVKIRKKYNIPENKKYIFSLCTLEPRKNLIFTVKNFVKFIEKNNIEDLVLVLGGSHWGIFIENLNNEINNLDKYKDKIIKAGYIDDEDLPSLYSFALCLPYNSIYEGFGLPPLEAMQCGCPVITSNTTSLPEVVGDAGIMIDPRDDEALISSYEKIYFDENIRKSLSSKGLQRAKEFSWKKCVDIMCSKFTKHHGCVRVKPSLLKGVAKTKIFNFITLFAIIKEIGRTKFLLFGILPVYKIKEYDFEEKHYLFGLIPVLKTYRKNQ